MVGGWYRKIPNKGQIYILWPDGIRTPVGEVEITVDRDGMMKANIRHTRLRIGWEFIRKGLQIMFYRGEKNG